MRSFATLFVVNTFFSTVCLAQYTCPTAPAGANDTRCASTAFVSGQIGGVQWTSNVQGSGLPGVINQPMIFLDIPPSASDARTLQINRAASYTGGTPGNVADGLFVFETVGANVANYEWAILGEIQNSATGGQNVAVNGTAFKQTNGTGPTWGGNFVLQESTGSANPTGPSIGTEIDIYANGTDTNLERAILTVLANKFNSGGTAPTITSGIAIGAGTPGASNATFVNGINFNGATYTNMIVAQSSDSITTAINLASATITGNIMTGPNNFFITNNGYIGIGENPQVNGMDVTIAAEAQFRANDTAAGGADLRLDARANAGIVGTINNNPLVFFTNNSEVGRFGSGAGLTVQAAIAFTSGQASVGGSATAGGVFGGQGSSFDVTIESHGAVAAFEVDTSGNPYLPSLANATTAKTGSVCWNTGGGALTYDNTNTCLVSDADLKDIEGPLTGCLAKIKNIRSIKFFYKDRMISPEEHAGFTAQNIYAVDPLFAARNDHGKPVKVRYIEMDALWNCAIQEQQARIEALEARLR